MQYDGSVADPSRLRRARREIRIRQVGGAVSLAMLIVAPIAVAALLLPLTEGDTGETLVREKMCVVIFAVLVGFLIQAALNSVVEHRWERVRRRSGLFRSAKGLLDAHGPFRPDITDTQLWDLVAQRDDLISLADDYGTIYNLEEWAARDDGLGGLARAHLEDLQKVMVPA